MGLGGVKYCLNALMAKESVNMQTFKNKKVGICLLISFAEKTAFASAFLKYKMQEYKSLKEEIGVLSLEELKLSWVNV